MNTQLWRTSVEIEELQNRHYVRVIEDGVVSVKGFGSRADAKAFAEGEQARLGRKIVGGERGPIQEAANIFAEGAGTNVRLPR